MNKYAKLLSVCDRFYKKASSNEDDVIRNLESVAKSLKDNGAKSSHSKVIELINAVKSKDPTRIGAAMARANTSNFQSVLSGFNLTVPFKAIGEIASSISPETSHTAPAPQASEDIMPISGLNKFLLKPSGSPGMVAGPAAGPAARPTAEPAARPTAGDASGAKSVPSTNPQASSAPDKSSEIKTPPGNQLTNLQTLYSLLKKK